MFVASLQKRKRGKWVEPHCKRGLEYGVRASVFYGNLREQTVFPRECLQEACVALTEISESLLEFPGELPVCRTP